MLALTITKSGSLDVLRCRCIGRHGRIVLCGRKLKSMLRRLCNEARLIELGLKAKSK
jgi:hypothetical protein